MRDRTTYMPFVTPIADIGGPVKPVAMFPRKILTMLITGRAGSAFNIAEQDFLTDILLLAMETVDTKVFSVQEKPPARIEVGQAVGPNLPRDGAGIFTKITGDLFEGRTVI